METIKNTALIVGANGVISTNLIEHLSSLGNWDIIGLSRRGGTDHDHVRYVAVDLLDLTDTVNKLSTLSTVTHIFYAAYQDKDSWAALVEPNLRMLVNVITAIEPVAKSLQHVSLMQGYKVYGAHLGPFKTPAKESDAGHMPPEFNTSQLQYLQQQQIGKQWTWSAIRPSVVGGTTPGNPMNLALLIAVYATISKKLNIPLRFPGKIGAYDTLLEMTDATLLAKATVWAATEPQAANQAFNINNGDLFRWKDLWPKIAKYFNMEVDTPLPLNLQTMMSDKENIWADIQKQQGLNYNYQEVSAWAFGDFVFSWNYDFFADGSKARRFGFHEYIDTEQMFFRLFDEMRNKQIIP
ncbi:SDR family oxidoreductase [Sphingobacterium detergens]|uniref:Nucleoside-diphosphate-sugar epimerase n=1 Tax=Sphingobacterium detergens TaxID=1145106 RepID=A0A420BIT8_SPHD1|nr:SDR family oxidoreductase [Sphingobacterium detergens]RKE56535.1 nucleoside-diphosphate-sugar epimerase [Sphingobacterium detergens]